MSLLTSCELLPSHPVAFWTSYPLILKYLQIPHPRAHYHSHAISFSFCFSSNSLKVTLCVFYTHFLTSHLLIHLFIYFTIFSLNLLCRGSPVTFLSSLNFLIFSPVCIFVINRNAWYFPDFCTLTPFCLHILVKFSSILVALFITYCSYIL